jgi:hypothetical protein
MDKKNNLWCDNQMLDENNIIICVAHLAEGRVFDCPYKNNDERLNAHYPCSDYKEKSIC